MMRGPHWIIQPGEAEAIAIPAHKLAKRIEPYVPAAVDRFGGPAAIAFDAAALALAVHVTIKARLTYESQLKKAGRELPPGVVAAIPPPAPGVHTIEPTAVHSGTPTMLDALRGDVMLVPDGPETFAITVADTEPTLLDTIAEAAVGKTQAELVAERGGLGGEVTAV